MDNLQINKNFQVKTQNFGRMICAVCGLALLALAAAFYAATSVQADALFPGNGTWPTTPAIYPEFTMEPRAPRLQLTAERFYDGQAHNPATRSATLFRGVASWYGPSFNGRLTANGEVYDMYAMTAATTESHPRLPLGTKVRVVDAHNGRSVVVRITDRGPLPNGRIIDLSYGAARKLAMVKPGVARVRVYVLHWGRNLYHAPSRS